MSQCNTQGCERNGHAVQLSLSNVPDDVRGDRYAACTVYLCIPCQESFFFAGHGEANTHFEVAIPATI